MSKKGYDEREKELLALARTEAGRLKLLSLWNAAKGAPTFAMGPIGAPVTEMIREILEHDFPNGP